MTIFPQKPILVECKYKNGWMELVEPHLTFLDIGFGYSLMVLLKKGYKTDGASVPKDELEDSEVAKQICKLIAKHYPDKNYKETLEYLIGTPFEMPRLLAAIVHDGLYDIKWKFRWICDRIYRAILSDCNYDEVRKEIEYTGIRLLGWKNWNKVTKKHRKKMKDFVSADIVRTKKISKLKKKMIEKYG